MNGDLIIDDLDLSGRYGDFLADFYDTLYPFTAGVDECVDVLAGLAGPTGSVLELGVGTGRVALPLADRVGSVTGVDASRRMLEVLRAKDPAERVTTVHAGFGSLDLQTSHDVVALVYNTVCCAPSQQEQVALLRTARRHVAAGGRVVVETFEPTRVHAQQGPETSMRSLRARGVLMESIEVVPAEQLMFVLTAHLDGSTIEKAATFLRYVWPAELTLLAELAGLRVVERRHGWVPTTEPAAGSTVVTVLEAT